MDITRKDESQMLNGSSTREDFKDAVGIITVIAISLILFLAISFLCLKNCCIKYDEGRCTYERLIKCFKKNVLREEVEESEVEESEIEESEIEES